MSNENKNQHRIFSHKISISNIKKMGFRINFKGFDSINFLKYETRWDYRFHRIYGNLDNRLT